MARRTSDGGEVDWRGLFDVWDSYHPSDSEEDPAVTDDWDDDAPTHPAIPTIDHLPDVVDYSARGPDDWIVSGPLGDAEGRGQRFDTELDAFRAMAVKYGQNRISRVEAGEHRWRVLVKAVK